MTTAKRWTKLAMALTTLLAPMQLRAQTPVPSIRFDQPPDKGIGQCVACNFETMQ